MKGMSAQLSPTVTVLMPTFNQATFLPRAIEGLLAQSFRNWELVIVNDGATDQTEEVLSEFLKDERVRYIKHVTNQGLGNSLNRGLAIARGDFIAYLPSDDIIYRDHLKELLGVLIGNPKAVIAYSGLRYNYNKHSTGTGENPWPQLVQVMHRKTHEKWVEREDLVTDNLNKMYWDKLAQHGEFARTGFVTCEWVTHPEQRHKKIQEPLGGINHYRSYYNVKLPMRFQSSVGNFIDEGERFRLFKETRGEVKEGLKILLVGELAYNPERVLALEERGHQLYGLWMKEPYWFNYVGPLPFGKIRDLDPVNWKTEIKRICPDVIYGLLNWQAVPFAHKILKENPGVPFVWNFKEGPFICLEKGLWRELIELYTLSDGQIYTSPEMRDWFSSFLPKYVEEDTLLLDGDLPKADWFGSEKSPLLSETSGEIHTVVPGRPIGLHPEIVSQLAAHGIHLHFYGDFNHGLWKEWIEKTRTMAGRFLHIHPNVDQVKWVEEFSQYDAGWLHAFESVNQGELRRANWDDLNYPARMATLALAGLPFIQKDNTGHVVATQTLAKDLDIGVFYRDVPELKKKLDDKKRMTELRKNVWEKRKLFTFDYHVDHLLNFFVRVIEKKKKAIALEVAGAFQASDKAAFGLRN